MTRPTNGSSPAVLPGRRTLYAFLLGLGILLAYSNALVAPFVFDDRAHIVQNPIIRHPLAALTDGGLERIGANPTQAGALRTRGFAYLTFALDHALWGLDPRGFHATNLAIHLLAALLLAALARRLLSAPRLATSRPRDEIEAMSWLAAALFALHPLQTQAVTYVVQRMASLAGCLGLAAVVLNLRSREASSDGRRLAASAASAGCLLLAMWTKENAVVFPVLVALVDWTGYEDGWRSRCRRLALPLATLVMPVGRLAGALASVAGRRAGTADGLLRAGTDLDRWSYLLTQARVELAYLRLWAWPRGQSLEHDVAPSRSLLEPATAISVLVVLALVAVGVRLLVRPPGGRAEARLVGFGIVWFFLAQAVESSIVPIADRMVEHRLYLPLAGLSIGAVAAGRLLLGARRRALVAGVAVALALLATTWARNEVWRDELRLWANALERSPGSPRAEYNVGTLLGERGHLDEAERHLRKALELDPTYFEALINLGSLEARRGHLEAAEALFRRASRERPDSWAVLLNLGDLARDRGRPGEARELWTKALAVAPQRDALERRLESLAPVLPAPSDPDEAP